MAAQLMPGVARSQAKSSAISEPTAASAAAPSDMTVEPESRALLDLEKAPPPPTNLVFLQYGVAFTAEVVSAAGPICDNITVPCILGAGGGITVRTGWRSAGALYLGGAYGFSKQDPNKLFRLAILQQARGEARYYFATGREIEPYATGGLGVAGYGNEWTVDTFGPTGFVGVGFEAQISRQTIVGLALAYRLLHFHSFLDTSDAARDSGIVQLVGLDLVLEQRDPIVTAKAH